MFATMSLVGTVQSIWSYPTKSLAAVPLREAQIESGGIPGDRGAALFVVDGHPRVGKTYRGKENNRLHMTDSVNRAGEMAATQGTQVELRSDSPHYFDSAPISLMLDRWVNEASELVGYALDVLRFRPNLFARAAPGFTQTEQELVGAILAIGTVVLQVRQPIERCVTITYDVQSGEVDSNVLRTIAQERGACIGVYCDVLTVGRLVKGDPITRQ